MERFIGPPPRMSQWVAAIRERTRGLTDPVDVSRVALLIEHLIAETAGDVPRTMQTIAPDGAYRAWGGDRAAVLTRDEQEQAYRTVLGQNPDAFQVRLDIERLFVGRDGICMDGVLHKEVTRAALADMGLPVPDGSADADSFVVSRRQALFVSFHGDHMAGEDLYWDEGAVIRRLDSTPVGSPRPIAASGTSHHGHAIVEARLHSCIINGSTALYGERSSSVRFSKYRTLDGLPVRLRDSPDAES